MTSKLSRLCDGILEAGWLAALIAVPLFFNIHSERVFEPDKVTILRSIAIFIMAAWLVRFIDQRGWRAWERLRWRHEESIWRLPFVLPIVVLVIVYLISTLFSVTPQISWSGSYQRLQGTYTMLAYIVFFAAAITTIRRRVQVNQIPTAIIAASIPVAFYGLIQHFGLDPLPWGGDVVNRVAGQLGNAIFIAAYLIMSVPLTLGRIIDASTSILHDEELSYANVLRSGVYIFALAIQLLAIYWSGSRGPLIGLALGLFSFVLLLLVTLRNRAESGQDFRLKDGLLAFIPLLPLLVMLLLSGIIGNVTSSVVSFAFFLAGAFLAAGIMLLLVVLRRGWRWLWLSWLLLAVLMGGWLLLFNLPERTLSRLAQFPAAGTLFEEQIAWKELPALGTYGRMLDPSQTTGREKTNRVRVLIWEGVVDLISPHSPLTFPDGESDNFNFWRPLIGYGPESMYVVYNRFYPPELATVEARNATPDRSHNETFDAFVITGLAGFLAWQALYVSVFYYGFRFLGVVSSRRDAFVLIGAWIGGALLGTILSLTLFDPTYLGVAIPAGTILGLIIYLFYYAFFTRSPVQSGSESFPAYLRSDYLLVNALLAAALAHYVEIHLGIAIAVTRLDFFLFVALIFVVAHKLPPATSTKEVAAARKTLPNSAAPESDYTVWGMVLAWSFLIALIIGTLGYDFLNYVLPADKLLESGADLPVLEIINQSLFTNAHNNFVSSPFIYLLIVIAWAMSVLIVFGEMIRQNGMQAMMPSLSEMPALRYKAASVAFLLIGLLGLLQRFIPPVSPSPTSSLVRSLLLIAGVISLWLAWSMVRGQRSGRLAAAIVSAAGLLLSLPILIAGSPVAGLSLAAICGLLLFLLWDPVMKQFLIPPIVLGALSLTIGFIYIYLHAVLLREALLYLVFARGIEPISTLFSLFFAPDGPLTTIEQARVLEAAQSTRLLSSYYLFLLLVIAAAGLSFAHRSMSTAVSWGRTVAFAAAVPVLLLAVLLIGQTNVKAVQADMIFKRAQPFDQQANQSQDPLMWDIAIAIYNKALELEPSEDYYYLFLGRALLERSGLSENLGEKQALLAEAQERLLEARDLNPLNTDHSANLARLSTRWAATTEDPAAREERLVMAETYYQEALQLSPHNSLIRNELARLEFDLRRNCDRAIAIFRQSLRNDPFFSETYFTFSDVLVACAAAQEDVSVRNELYDSALQTIDSGLSLDPEQTRAWIQAGQINYQLSRYDEALAAFEQARTLNEANDLPTWNVDYLRARVFRDMGNVPAALALAQQALLSAPADVADDIQAFVDEIEQLQE